MEIVRHLITANLDNMRVYYLSLVGQMMVIYLCNIGMKRRRSFRNLLIFMVVKLLLSHNVSYLVFDGLLPITDLSNMLRLLLNGCLNFSMLFMVAYTFNEPFIKSTLFVSGCEILITCLVLPSVMVANLIGGKEDLFVFYGKFHPIDLLIPVINAVLIILIGKLFRPVLSKYRSLKFQNMKLWYTVWGIYFGSVQLMTLVDLKEGGSMMMLFYVVYLLLAFWSMTALYLLYWKYQHSIQIETAYLNTQLELLESQYTTVQKQSVVVEATHKMIDEQMNVLRERVQQNAKTFDYMNTLREEYDKLNTGLYCNDYLIDAILSSQEQAAEKRGIQIEYQLQKYQLGEIKETDLAKVLLVLFECASYECGKDIRLSMTAVRNQLAVAFMFTAGTKNVNKRKFRRVSRTLRDILNEYDGTVQMECGDDKVVMTLMMRQGHSSSGIGKE